MGFEEFLPLSMFGALLFFLLWGYPVAFSLGGTAIIFALIGYFTGHFRITDFGNVPSKIFERLKGGLYLSVLLVGTLMAASTGIIGATVVTMGVIVLPTMLKHKYNKELSCGIIAASGTLGQIIPPQLFSYF